MYKDKQFDSITEMLKWLNTSGIEPSDIISIVPFQKCVPSGEGSLVWEYKIIYTAGRYQKLERKVPLPEVQNANAEFQIKEEELALLRKEVARSAVVITNLEKEIVKERTARTAAERREKILKERTWWERLLRKGE